MDYHLESGGMALHDTVGVNSTTETTKLNYLKLKINAQVPGIWAKGCVFDDCVRVI